MDYACIASLYPTPQRVTNNVFLDDHIAKINYPFGPISHEPIATIIAEFILEIANQIKLQEDYKKHKFLKKIEMSN